MTVSLLHSCPSSKILRIDSRAPCVPILSNSSLFHFRSVRSCSFLKIPTNGYMYPPMCGFYPVSGTNCTFGCHYGFKPRAGGIDRVSCGLDGVWNNNVSSTLTCEGIHRRGCITATCLAEWHLWLCLHYCVRSKRSTWTTQSLIFSEMPWKVRFAYILY